MKFNLLAFEASSMFTSVALLKGNSNICQEYNILNDNSIYKHAENIIPMASKLLNEANINIKELTLLSFGHGPGSFIGTRIACGITNGISLALDIPIISFSSHEIMLEEVYAEQKSIIFIASEAGNNEIYFSIYISYIDNNKHYISYKPLQKIILISIKEINDFIRNFDKNVNFTNYNKIIIGNSFSKHQELQSLFKNINYIDIIFPKAQYLAKLSKRVFCYNKLTINSNLPVYIRNKIALTIKERNDLKLNQL